MQITSDNYRRRAADLRALGEAQWEAGEFELANVYWTLADLADVAAGVLDRHEAMSRARAATWYDPIPPVGAGPETSQARADRTTADRGRGGPMTSS